MATQETTLTPVDVQPGINRDQTDYSTKGQYVDGQWVRFRSGRAQKMGGFVVEPIHQNVDTSVTTFKGVPRIIHSWADLEEKKWRAVGTHNALQLQKDATIYDITPIESSVRATNCLTTSVNSPYVIVSDASHGRQVDDWVEIIAAASVGNITFNDVVEVVSVITADSYLVSLNRLATMTTVQAGGSVELNYLLPSGYASNTSPTAGWGGGSWGTVGVSTSAGWNNPRGSSVPKKLRQWSLDNYGQDLLACPRGGRLYVWTVTSGPETRAKLVSASPSVINVMLVSEPSRHVLALGCTDSLGDYDPLLVRWSDAENYNDWTTSPTSEAGEFRLKGGSYIVGAVQSSKEIVVVTDNAAHRIKYVGGDAIFGSDQIGSDVGLVSQNAIVDINGRVLWMGYNSFLDYDQRVRKLKCTLIKDTFDSDRPTSLNFAQKEKVAVGENSEYSEVIWFYPSQNSMENDRYIIYNYLEDLWYPGTIERTCWDDVNVFEKPYAMDSSGVLYTHEETHDANGTPIESYIETGEVDISDGNQIMYVDKFIPDFILPDNKPIKVTLYFRKYPGGPYQEKTYTFTNATQFINMRVRGRRVKVRYTVDGLGCDFEIGSPEFGIKPDGGR